MTDRQVDRVCDVLEKVLEKMLVGGKGGSEENANEARMTDQ